MQELFKKVFHLDQDVKNLQSEIRILESKCDEKRKNLEDVKVQLWDKMETESIVFIGDEGVCYLCTRAKSTKSVNISRLPIFQL